MTHPRTLLLTAIPEALKRSGDVATYAGERIYHLQAPPGTLLDFVEFEVTAGGPTNRSPREDFDVTVEVRGVSTKEARALALAEAISHTMLVVGLSTPGWDYFHVDESDWFVRKFWRDGQEYLAAGAFYEIRGCKRG